MSYGRSGRYDIPSDGTISGTLVAALLASLTFGELAAATGHLEAIPAMYGLEDTVNIWGFVVGHAFVAAVTYVAGLTRVARHPRAPAPLAGAVRSTFLGGCFGVAYGTLCWLVVVAHGVPLLVEMTGGTMSVPCQHGASLLSLVVYGAVLGTWYPLVRTAVDRGRSRRGRR